MRTEDDEKMDALGVLNLAQAGDARAEKIVQHRAGIVADIIVNLSLILNPGLILLEGEVGSHPALISGVQKQLQESEFAVTKIGAGKLGNTSVLWGAIAIALEMIPSVLLPSPMSLIHGNVKATYVLPEGAFGNWLPPLAITTYCLPSRSM
jgi:glucokinase